ncbi:hypothetical protein [Pseudoalteromonas lipolytica]|nr:hypothetical protein [Pseudoalteromonas lipolytica]
MSTFSINNLPYDLPNNSADQLRVLATIIEVPYSLVIKWPVGLKIQTLVG